MFFNKFFNISRNGGVANRLSCYLFKHVVIHWNVQAGLAQRYGALDLGNVKNQGIAKSHIGRVSRYEGMIAYLKRQGHWAAV